MEFPGLGKRCGLVECKQLDFLPFKCSHCELVFCKDHFMPDKHMCTHDSVSVTETGEPLKHYRCTYDDCSMLSVIEMCCKVCNKHFCLHHRHHGCNDVDQATIDKERNKWEAPKRQFELAKAEAERQVGIE
jgi:AN1-like Zinc finger.